MLGLIGGILIIFGCALYGFMCCQRLCRRIAVLKDMTKILGRLESYIDYSVMDMKEIFAKLSEKHFSSPVGSFIKNVYEELKKTDKESLELIWTSAANECLSPMLKHDETELIKEAGKLSDYLDKNSQINLIQSVHRQLREHLEELNGKATGKMKAYMVAGVSVGMIFVIALI